MTESSNGSHSSHAQPAANQEQEAKVRLTPALITFGVIAILLGLGAGLIMSSATFFK